MFNSNIPLKINVQNKVLTAINEWLKKTDFSGKVIYRSWLDSRNASIKYADYDFRIKCDLAVFLNINDVVYRIFITFKINNYKYELNSHKKALLIERRNGLVAYDDDAKKAFKVTQKDKNAIMIFVVNEISSEQTNSWKSRVLCCHSDNIIPTIKHQLSEIKEQEKLLRRPTKKTRIF